MMNFHRTSIEPQVATHDLKLNYGEEIVTWWYCGLIKNHRDQTQPLALVCFRKLSPANQLGAFIERRIPLTWLGQFRIGTIWKLQHLISGQKPQNISTEAFEFTTAIFHVDFSRGAWRISFPSDDIKKNGQSVILEHHYPLADSFHGNQATILLFPFSNDSVGLIIPCIEFFSRCYGRSQYVTQTLSTYAWDIAQDRLFARGTAPAPPGTWGISLANRSVNGDTVFLAHVKHEEYAARAAKVIYSQIDTAAANRPDRLTLPEIGPWFEGSAQIKVKGLWIEDGKRFLGLQIVGCSEPYGVPIFRDRQNSNRMLTGPTVGNIRSDGTWNGVPPSRVRKPSEIINLTSNEAPDHEQGTVSVDDPDFEILGVPRIILDANHEKVNRDDAHRLKIDDSCDCYSAGERFGSGKNIRQVCFQAHAVMESSGALRDVWNALKKIQKANDSVIKRIESYSTATGFSDDKEPQIIPFREFPENEKKTLGTKISNWPYLDIHKKIIRGALLARVTTTEDCFYFFEPQRRPRLKTEKTGEKCQGEESFRGLIFTLKDNASFEIWLEQLMNKLRYSCGVLTRVLKECPGNSATFNHIRPGENEMPCERAIKNKLSSFGVDFSVENSEIETAAPRDEMNITY